MPDVPLIQIGSDCFGIGKTVKGFAGLIGKLVEIRGDNPAVRQRKANKAQRLKIKGYLDSRKLASGSGLEPGVVEALMEAVADELGSDNAASIVMGALPAISEDAPTDGIELEWLALFSDCSRNVFDSDLQAAWSRVLSREANEPGSVPKRVLFTLSGLSKDEAEAFLSLQRASPYGGDPFVFDAGSSYYAEHGLNLNFLIEAGLIEHSKMGQLVRDVPISDDIEVGSASRSPILLSVADDALEVYLIKQQVGPSDTGSDYKFPMGCMEYTPQGRSLAHTIETVQFDDYAVYLKEELQKQTKYVAKVVLVKDGRTKFEDRIRKHNE